MAFQVKEFDSIQKGTSTNWKFKLINKTTSQFNFYDINQSSRTLLHLSNDIYRQIDLELHNSNKTSIHRTRLVRKSCQKIIKSLKLSLTSFADDIGQQLESVRAFFKKQKLPEHKLSAMVEKCKKWAMSTWLSLQNDHFFHSTQKYIQSYIKDAKKTNPDFQLTTQLYALVLGEDLHRETDQPGTQHESLIQIDVNLEVEGKYISQCLLYDTKNLSYIKTRTFSQHFVSDLVRQNKLTHISKQRIEQLQQQVRIQIRSQCLYKTLLKKHASVLLNFSTIEIPSQVREYLIPIDIKLRNEQGQVEYEDYFEWDILNESNNIEQFCEQLINDMGLSYKYFSQLCYSIRTEVNAELEWKFLLLVKTFKSIHKDKESPKLNSQTTALIRKNLPYSMDVQMLPENKQYKPNENIAFLNSDVFSLLSRNIDILPEEFQSFLHEKDTKNDEQTEKTEAASAKSSARIRNLADVYQKKAIKVETNPYLSGINQSQANVVWKRLLDEKTTCE